MTFSEGKDDLTDKIDFIVCLGGDGTLLYASSLFQQSVPPVMAFHLGSLGFLVEVVVDDVLNHSDSASMTLANEVLVLISATRARLDHEMMGITVAPGEIPRELRNRQQFDRVDA